MAQVPTGNDPRAQGGLSGPLESRTRDALPPLPLQGLEIVFRVGLALLQVNSSFENVWPLVHCASTMTVQREAELQCGGNALQV